MKIHLIISISVIFLFHIMTPQLVWSQGIRSQPTGKPSVAPPPISSVPSSTSTTHPNGSNRNAAPLSGALSPGAPPASGLPAVANERVDLDPNAKLLLNEEQISSVFRDMVVVQRKAKDKAQKFLVAPSASFEFSDGPKAMYPINLDLGYSISDFWEIYLNYVPSFMIKNRSIVDKVSQLRTTDGKVASIDASNPKSQIGVNILWVPAYGKDSWGPYRIVRSDTFFKFGFSNVSYDAGSGNRINAMVGKTYFLSQYLNLRLALGYMNIESYSVSNGSLPQKSADTVIIMDTGLVFYF